VHVEVSDTNFNIPVVAVPVPADPQITLHAQRAGTLMVCISVSIFSCQDPAIHYLLLSDHTDKQISRMTHITLLQLNKNKEITKMHHFGTPKVRVASAAPTSKVRAPAMLLLPIIQDEIVQIWGGIATA